MNLTINQGYGGGIVAGLNVAKGNYIGWAHADLQTPLLDFSNYLRLLKEKIIFLVKVLE